MLKDFDETVMLDFEGYKFCAMAGYDNVLRSAYGDYMQLPPENKRRIHGFDYVDFEHSYHDYHDTRTFK